jgi:Mrp family chromosome partitioning ATPase/capsular polysaccharide biosynthesis protein
LAVPVLPIGIEDVNSGGEAFSDRPTTLAEYQAILRRRKWIIIALPVIAAVVAYALSAMESPRYKANAQVRVDPTNPALSIIGLSSQPFGDPTLLLTLQANVARDRPLAERVAERSGIPGMTAERFLGESSAASQTDSPLLDLAVTYPTAAGATRLVNTYATELKDYNTELQKAKIDAMVTSIEKTLKPYRVAGNTANQTYLGLAQFEAQLRALGASLASNTNVQLDEGGFKVRPRPKRNAIIGGLLGLVLGIGLAFLAEALDKRVRTEKQIEETLGIPLLGRVPRPARALRKANRLVMLAEPTSVHAQTFRRLRTSLEFVNFEQGARKILVTSALPREGKSTTVANLAVALARAGRRIAVADLDLRRPFLNSFFQTGSDHGFTDVVVNRVKLERAVRSIALPGSSRLGAAQATNGRPPAGAGSAGNGRADVESVLHVLPAGSIPPAADEFLETEGVSAVLEDLSGQFDIVLLDAPPMLAVGDVIALSTKVDAIVVVTRLGIHRRQLEELARQLHTCRAPILGFVLTGASHGDSYSYGYGYDERVYDEVRQETESPSERS